MKSTKKLAAALLAIIMCLGSLAACGPKDSAPTDSAPIGSSPTDSAPIDSGGTTATEPGLVTPPPAGANLADHIDIIVDSSLTIINPFMLAATGGPAQKAADMVHDKLLEHVKPGVLGPQLATKWETDDYQTYVFYLRDDVNFHNGDHFTAEDVLWNIEISREFPGSPAFTRWSNVNTARVLDTYVIEMVLHEPNVDFPFEMADYQSSICSRGAYAENPDNPEWGHIGTGPFKVVAFSSNDFLTVERFDDYWGELPPTRSITHWTIPEQSTRTVMLQTGKAQVCFSLTPEDLDILDASPDFNVFRVLLNDPTWLGFNNQGDEIMMDPNFRLAVAHALNVDDIATVAMGNWGKPVWDGNVWGPETQFRLEGLPKREYDPDLAREYLEQSVYSGETIEILAAVASNSRAAQIVQLQLLDVGISTNIETMELAGFLEAMAYNPESTVQMHIFSGGMLTVALQTMRLYYPGMNSNRININNDYLVELIDKLAVTNVTAEREEIAYEIQRFFWEDISAVPLFFRVSGIPAVNGIGGMKLTSDAANHSLRGLYWDLNETPTSLLP